MSPARRLNPFGHLQLNREERLLLFLMGALVALLFGSYTVAKVLRDSLFISEFGARALPFGYIGVATASVVLVWFEPRLARRLSHLGMSTVAQLFAITMSLFAAIIFPVEKHWLAAAFYVWTGSQVMMLIPRFWVLALDVWDSRRARTIFPLLSGCGLIGGVAGGAFASLATSEIGTWGLLWSLAGLLVAVLVLSILLQSRRPARSAAALPLGGQSRLDLVLRSPLLRYLAAALILSVIVATLVDFQFKYLAEKAYPNRAALTRFLGAFHAGLDGFAILVQFGSAGWILRHAGLGPSAGIQAVSVLTFSVWSLLAPAWGVVVALRWVQGVTFQTLGKSVAEIYYMAVRSPDRQAVKPAIDVIAERGADAFVGLLLVVLLHLIGVRFKFLAGLTAAIAALWLVVQWKLQREYMDAFRDSLARRWIEPEMAAHPLGTRPARKVIRKILESGEEREVIVALELCRAGRYRAPRAIRACLEHPSAAVRAAAVRTMADLGIKDPAGKIRSFLKEKDQSLKGASIQYLVAHGRDSAALARKLLEGDDSSLRDHVLEALASRPEVAARAVTLELIDRWLDAGSAEDLAAAGRALGLIRGPAAVERVKTLLARNDLESKRSALLAAAANGAASELADEILPLLSAAQLRAETLEALSAMGDRAVPSLERRIQEGTEEGARALAARALARIASRSAVAALARAARSEDHTTRHLGIRNLNRIRLARDHPVVPRALVHRMFLRELRDYRNSLERTLVLAGSEKDELRILAESYRESADRALERACRILGCWYEAAPLEGVYRGLRSGERGWTAQALEYLAGILPRHLFRTVRSLFEETQQGECPPGAGQDAIVHCIQRAWERGDAWLRACAVRAARVVPQIDLGAFQSAGAAEDPLVLAELESLAAGDHARRHGRI